MATPTTAEKLSLGNRDGVLATFTSLSNADTWVTGLGKVEAVFITDGASGQTLGATYSGGTVTFAASAGLSDVKVLAIGYK
jgi:hypothetical protein